MPSYLTSVRSIESVGLCSSKVSSPVWNCPIRDPEEFPGKGHTRHVGLRNLRMRTTLKPVQSAANRKNGR